MKHKVGDKLTPDRSFDYNTLLSALKELKRIDGDVVQAGDLGHVIYYNHGFEDARGCAVIVYNIKPAWDHFYTDSQRKVDEATEAIVSLTGFSDYDSIREILSGLGYDTPKSEMSVMSKEESDGFLRAVREAGFEVRLHWNGYSANTMSVGIT
jgi:hypothetical protein